MKREEHNRECPFKEQLVTYLYGELAPSEVRSFEEHLAGCPVCRRDVEEFRSLREALGQWQINDIPHMVLQVKPGFWRMLAETLRTAPLWGRLIMGTAAALLILAVFNVRIEVSRAAGFRFQASLVPVRIAPDGEGRPTMDEKHLAALFDERIRQLQAEHERRLARALQEAVEQVRADQSAALARVVQTLQLQQRQQFRQVLGELENQRSGALTFADLFFTDRGGN
jgi:anti-sigma factor RsiW